MKINKSSYQTLPNIRNKIEERLKKLKLKANLPIGQAIKEKRHFFNSICLSERKRKVFIKILLQNEERFFFSILREMKIVKFLTGNPIFKELKITPYLKGSAKDSPPWFIHQYIEGDVIGDFYEIHKPYQDKKYIPLLIKNLRVIQSVPKPIIEKLTKSIKEIETANYARYPKIVEDFQKNAKNPDLKINFKKIYDFLSIHQDFLQNSRKVITHGDFTLSNNIFSKGNIYLTDWEWARLDNAAADLAHLWLQTWRYPKWRKNLLLTFLTNHSAKEKKEIKMLFRITVIIQALGEIRWNTKICEEEYKKKAVTASVKAIDNALKSFNNFV